MLLHCVGTVRAFYASVAKAVHAQARRRDDPTFQPNASMKAASVTLGVILKRNLKATDQVHSTVYWAAGIGLMVPLMASLDMMLQLWSRCIHSVCLVDASSCTLFIHRFSYTDGRRSSLQVSQQTRLSLLQCEAQRSNAQLSGTW